MKNLTRNLPDSPGVYLFKDAKGKVLYVGKAGNLKRRVSSYFKKAHDVKIEKLISEAKKVDFQKTDTSIEALILEAELIKTLKPKYNVKDKDDKSFLYVEITDDEFPRVVLVRGKEKARGTRYGPFTSAQSIRKALRIIRRIFPYNVHMPSKVGHLKRPCFDYQIGLCPGTCIGSIDKKEYKKTIKHIKLFLDGKKERVIKSLEREMAESSKKLDFETSERLRRQIFALRHIRDVALINSDEFEDGKESDFRIEGYDISNISGTSAVGSMVVFIGNKPDISQYRKFKIRTIKQPNDVGMLKEVIHRRFKNDWPHPNLILVDGGKGQINAVNEVIDELGLKFPIVGIAKGPTRKKNEFFGRIPKGITKKLLIQVRDEAHRFAVRYHRALRSGSFIEKK